MSGGEPFVSLLCLSDFEDVEEVLIRDPRQPVDLGAPAEAFELGVGHDQHEGREHASEI